MEEYKTLLSICSDAEQRRGIEKKMITFLENDLSELEVCNTSSDEEGSYMKMKAEKTKESSSSKATKRVNEATEKYNSDLDSADEKIAHEDLSQGPETPYTSDSGSYIGSWNNNDNYVEDEQDDHNNEDAENEDNVEDEHSQQSSPDFLSEKNLERHKVSSYTSAKSIMKPFTGTQDSIFTADEETQYTPHVTEQSYSASSQLSQTFKTAPTVIATQSQLKTSKLPPGLPRPNVRSSQPTSSKSAYFANPPPSTSKIVTRGSKSPMQDTEDPDVDSGDLYSMQKRKRRR